MGGGGKKQIAEEKKPDYVVFKHLLGPAVERGRGRRSNTMHPHSFKDDITVILLLGVSFMGGGEGRTVREVSSNFGGALVQGTSKGKTDLLLTVRSK
jgi:hypothetical protein